VTRGKIRRKAKRALGYGIRTSRANLRHSEVPYEFAGHRKNAYCRAVAGVIVPAARVMR